MSTLTRAAIGYMEFVVPFLAPFYIFGKAIFQKGSLNLITNYVEVPNL